ncbi:MAG: penicillin-binding protein 2 [Defluviicoccus sp.]|nr:penicillin-binding protein 2 [Defluviicoccus sp.]MDE0276908.1 penicillin-binding protein 2 [Defluviicoccus sp.]
MTDRVRYGGADMRFDGDRKRAIEVGRGRLLLTGAVLSAAFVAIGIRLFDVAVLQAGVEPRDPPPTQIARGAAAKTEITDRNGVVLAVSLGTAALYANTAWISDADATANALAKVLPDLDRKRAAERLRVAKRYVSLRRHLTPNEQYAILRLGIPGLVLEPDQRRVYPMGRLAAHVVGFSDPDGKGLAGIERQFDTKLREGSGSLSLSIDIRVQHVLRNELSRAMTGHRAVGAAGIVLDTANGELIAVVSLPDFDPNRAHSASAELRFNRATLGIYEMGSTFKILSTALALDAGAVTLSDRIDATRPIRIARFTIRDFHAKARVLTVPEVFIYSSNIGAAKLGIAVGGKRMRRFLADLGMFRKTPVEIGENGRPLFPRRWRQINTMTVSFGHGVAVSPLHLTSAVAAVVNGGTLHAPTLLKREPQARPEGKRVLSRATSDKMRRLMRLVVAEGTGSRAAAAGYLVGGKTGTAEQAGKGGYREKRLLSSFVAAFPMHRPRYVVLALLDRPRGTSETRGYATGGWVAAPVVGRTVARIGPLLGVKPVDEGSRQIERRMQLEVVKAQEGSRRLASR